MSTQEGYDKLFRHFDDILEAVCGKWKLCILIETFRQTGDFNFLVGTWCRASVRGKNFVKHLFN